MRKAIFHCNDSTFAELIIMLKRSFAFTLLLNSSNCFKILFLSVLFSLTDGFGFVCHWIIILFLILVFIFLVLLHFFITASWSDIVKLDMLHWFISTNIIYHYSVYNFNFRIHFSLFAVASMLLFGIFNCWWSIVFQILLIEFLELCLTKCFWFFFLIFLLHELEFFQTFSSKNWNIDFHDEFGISLRSEKSTLITKTSCKEIIMLIIFIN